MVSVFPGRFVTKPQKAPALTVSQTVKAVADKYRGRRAAENAREGSERGEKMEDSNRQSIPPEKTSRAFAWSNNTKNLI